MTEALEDRLIDLRERVDVLLDKQKAYRRKRLKTKQGKQQSKTKTLQNPEPRNLHQYQIKDREQNFSKQRRTEENRNEVFRNSGNNRDCIRRFCNGRRR